ncbi:MAG TPA: exopolysaccharide Pel transporter PelG [Thermoanaerobaculia bacterium]|nr:exopolysaccharide Pel transporter PelG [Thermoanaerobaculia bacterium]
MTTEALGQQIIHLLGTPKDEWEIAAQLEVMGLRDADARTTYGTRDLFELAREIFTGFQRGAFEVEIEGDDPEKRVHPALRFLQHYLIGLSFSLPMALQALTMLLWGYGVWGAIDIDLRTGSAIALGFIASYIVTGGFAQAIVRRGLFYIYQDAPGLARSTALRSWSIALRISLALIPVAFAINLAFRILPWSMLAIAAGYYIALAILWLNWSLLYLLRKTHLFVVTTAIALVAVFIAAKGFGTSPVLANACGLFVADALSFVLALRDLNRIARDRLEAVNPPRLTVLVYSTSRFFLYGLLYNTFLFADRIVAWTSSVGREDFPPYSFWLNVRYELGMDLALIVVMVLSGVVEHAAQRFSETLIPNEKRAKSSDTETFLDRAVYDNKLRTLHLALASLFAFGLAVTVALTLREFPTLRLHDALVSQTTSRVFWIAAIAYVIYMLAVQNMLLLLTLSRVELVVRAVAIALAVNVTIGFIASRAIHYSTAVFGLLAGAIVLWWLTRRALRNVLERLDYFYYSAY